MDKVMFMASLVAMAAGLVMMVATIRTKSKYLGIGMKEFISTQYMMAQVPFAIRLKKKLLLRRVDISDICEIGDMPNWLTILLTDKTGEAGIANKEIVNKSEAELIEDTKKFYSVLQSLAEKAIVGYPIFVAEWKKVDPEYTGKLPRMALDFIFTQEMAQTSNLIKKKSSYSALRYLASAGIKPHPPTSETKSAQQKPSS